MRFLLLTLFGCLTFAAGRAQQPAKIEGAHLHMEVASHDFGDVPRKGGDLVREFTFTNDGCFIFIHIVLCFFFGVK